jgi:hypothetical protein
MKLSRDKISLVVANLLPVIGIAFFNWSLFNFLFLYWLESAVIGFYFILKMVKGAKFRGGKLGLMLFGQSVFFVFHYGAFMSGHLFFILFISQRYQSVMSFSSSGFIFLVFNLIGLFISHGISYQQNFIGKKEYEKIGNLLLLMGPYDRIFVMHFVVSLGSILVSALNWPLYSLVGLKIFVDYLVHTKTHQESKKLEEMSRVFEQLTEKLNSEEIIIVDAKNAKIGDIIPIERPK